MSNKMLYVILMFVIMASMVVFQWYFSRTLWESADYYTNEKTEEIVVFSQKLKKEHDIVVRLDLEDGAEDKARLVLEMPNNEKIEWTQGYKQTQKQLEIVTPQDGLYKLTLFISPSEDKVRILIPNIKVKWYFR